MLSCTGRGKRVVFEYRESGIPKVNLQLSICSDRSVALGVNVRAGHKDVSQGRLKPAAAP